MFNNVTPIAIRAITPIHAGIGRNLGLIDMPIQKEKHTGIPKIEGSTIKGCMKEQHRIKNGKNTYKLFGGEDDDKNAGIIGFTDARLLFYPIPTLKGIFAYVTCPYLLNRYFEDISLIPEECDKNVEDENSKYEKITDGKCVILKEINDQEDKKENKKIILDEYSFEIEKNKEISNKFDLKKFDLKNDKYIVVISDNDFVEIITLCKEIITRNRIDESTGTVTERALFVEEYLPSEAILYTLMLQNSIVDKENLYDNYKNNLPKITQIGGNTTIGKGIVKMKIIE
ncbi:type III-B CRISPR module RAMP protein Cmr4 [Clostridium fermenticellae]|uniref:Type III-B CRISPR module RAMP protein Cmr4 n=1 Tax=Clostridium fermenticellae TaxID=2068654 RepID=A0A386H434_9CLOT|nr:type III-B CRISPR module RAMP protein Cmr4 [Clostridium fermenticellae]AYD40245.1 type III-B CRISPR module RAMP protein Cmr4 [Clostridium fermenticellae]